MRDNHEISQGSVATASLTRSCSINSPQILKAVRAWPINQEIYK